MSKRVVVTGIGILAPSGATPEEFWRSNAEGRTHLRYEPLMREIGMKSSTVASIEGFDLADHHSARDAAELEKYSRFVQLSVTAGLLACRDARLDRGGFDPGRAGTVLSSAIGGTPEFQTAYEEQTDHGRSPLRPFPEDHPFYDSVFLNYTPSWLARRFGLRGPSGTLTTGCTAGLDALGLAFEQIRQGELDLAVAGAGEAPLSGLAYSTLDVIGSLAVVDGPPETASRPFDATRGGFVLGEGAAALVLEEYEHALARGADVHAEVLGFASSNNAFHMSDLAQDGLSMSVVIEDVLRDAGIDGTEIDYVNAHGSSTPQNDLFETQALKRVLGTEHAHRTPVSSTKSMIGHSLSSASMVGAVAAMGALRGGVVPPTMNYAVPDPDCDLDYVPNQARAHDTRTALVSASGFGGIHSCAVLRRVEEPPGTVRTRTLSGSGATALVLGEAAAPGPVTLFLHGFGGSAAHWGPVLRSMAVRDPDARAVALDLPGHGTNSLAVDCGRDRVRAFLLDALRQLGCPPEVTVVGHSLGGLVALDLAATTPERIRRVAVVGSATRVRLHPLLVDQVLAGEIDEDFLAAGLRQPEDHDTVRLLVDGFRALRLPSADADVWGVRQNVDAHPTHPDVPALVLIAADDRVVSPRRSRALAEQLPQGRAEVLPEADHYVLVERPRQVWERLRDFLTAASPRTEV
ncbi:alpha/beta fold hydrolase [Streptomyces sp. NPDC005438]|uniref:alpha/beta fold hydrolase n=1 Tax=Streptomyces sp. NPDC005438 TaxID=3156880 RepID=UPI00339DCF61